jgi:hypothetical protein
MKKSLSLELRFTRLQQKSYCVTSDRDEKYNCIAWALKDTSRRWEKIAGEPGCYWPPELESDETVKDWIDLFLHYGFVECDSSDLDLRFEKVAIYGYSDQEPSHVCRQLEDGQWTSKLGGLEDISHPDLETLEEFNGFEVYGKVRAILKRVLPTEAT